MVKIKTKKVSKENFSRFGKVVLIQDNKPTSEDSSYKFWSNIASYSIEDETEIGICTVYTQKESVLNIMERHLKTPEILIPIDAPFVLPLLKEGESEGNAEAFQVGIGEAVVINKAIWHGACLPVGKDESSYFVIFRKETPDLDVYKKEIEEIEIQI